jgi:hypothetical protein
LSNSAPRLTVEEALDALPGSIRVGPFDYAIERMNPREAAARDVYGLCSNAEYKISISPMIGSAVKLVDTFLHEVGHAIYNYRHLEDEDKQERVVGNFSVGFTAVFRDNPWLLTWLADCLR